MCIVLVCAGNRGYQVKEKLQGWLVCRVGKKPFQCRANWRRTEQGKHMGQGNGDDWTVFSRSAQRVLPYLERTYAALLVCGIRSHQHCAVLTYMLPALAWQVLLLPCGASIYVKADVSVLFRGEPNLCHIGFVDTTLHGLLSCCICIVHQISVFELNTGKKMS